MARFSVVTTKIKTSWESSLDYFLLFKKSQGLAVRTLNDYREHVTQFFKVSGVDLDSYERLKLGVMRYFADSSSLAPATFNTRRKILKVYFSWLVSEGMIPENPVNVKKRKEDDVPRSVKEEIVIKLLELPDQSTFSGLRDYVLILLTMDAGIRPREVAGLKLKDFNLSALEVKIPADIAKTRVSRTFLYQLLRLRQ